MNNILEKDLKTYITRDYSVFKYLSGNRDINLHNVNNIVKNVLENGLLPTIVIVNENMEVIDGQHRIEAFKQLNLPVEFQIRKGLGLKDCIAYNVSSKKWETVDYIKSYAERGIDDYITLKKCIDEYEGVHMINKIKLFFKRLFCKHEFTWCVKNEMFHCISGETQYLVCLKCGKVKDTRFVKYE